MAERALIERQFALRLKTLLKFVRKPSEKRLVEIGAAYGFFLSVARAHFHSVEGFDISRDAAAHAQDVLKLRVRAGDFLDYPDDSAIDVLCLWDTIEHIQNPHLVLEKAAERMRPGSIVALTTGDIESRLARWRGARWRQIHPPTHLHYFGRSTLTRLLETRGFEILSLRREGMYRSMDTIAYILLNIKHHQPKLYAGIRKLGLLNWNVYTNLYDIVFVIAAKR